MMIARILILALGTLGMTDAQGQELLEGQNRYAISLLPQEIQAHIFNFEDLESLERCRRVCKPWRQLIDQDVEGGFVLQCLRDFFRKGDPARSAEEFKRIFLAKDREDQPVLRNIINELQEELRLTSKKEAYQALLDSKLMQSCSGMKITLSRSKGISKEVASPYIPLNLFEAEAVKALKDNDIKITLVKVTGNISQIFAMKNILQNLPGKVVELVLKNLDLITLSRQIETFSDLQRLHLSNNLLTDIPPEISQLTNLQELLLDSNELKEVPDEMWRLTKLQKLNLSDNWLSSVSSKIKQLINLQELLFDNNELKEVPAGMWRLTNLQELSLSNNSLSRVPPEIRQLTNLQRLWLDNNKLEELPAEMWLLTNLVSLNLSNNSLGRVPPEIRYLRKLKHLFLSNNQLSSLLFNVDEFPELIILDLKGNPMNNKSPQRHCTVS